MTLAAVLLASALVLPAPDFKSTPVGPIKTKSPLELKQVSSEANDITDDEEWFAANELTPPSSQNAPRSVPAEYEGLPLVRVIPSAVEGSPASVGGRSLDFARDDTRTLVIYGRNFGEGLLLVSYRSDGSVEYAFDFSNYRLAPRNVEGDLEFVGQQINYATQVGDVLYVSHGHNTYARSSHGMNAYVSAIKVPEGEALWHSAPLVSNAENFVVIDDYLITGYGFTAEPDFLYVLRREDGKAVARIPVKSGPEYLLLKDERLYVRTYNTNYVFRLSPFRLPKL